MIPFVDLKRQHASISPELDAAISRVLESCQFQQGPDLAAFEAEFAAYIGVPYCVGTGSGTVALKLALEAFGIGPGDEVIVPVNTFIATALAVTALGANPVLVDVHPDSLSIDVDAAARAVTRKTRAIVPVHLFGRMADMDACLRLARRYSLVVVEDAAQAHGAKQNGRRAGSIGDAGCFSFYPSKNLGAMGDGGAFVTSTAEAARAVRLARWFGQDPSKRYVHESKGENALLDTLQAAVLRAKLPHLDRWNDRRRQAAVLYRRYLEGAEGVVLPSVGDIESHVFHLFVVLLSQRESVIEALREAHVSCGIHYPTPLHLQPALRDLGYRPGDFPVAESCARRLLSLPIFPEISEDEVREVCSIVKRSAARCAVAGS
jgi:dTDP-4-amino-4,6-dideoxygalactose transaminase